MQKTKSDDLNEAIRMRLPLKSIQHLVLNGGCDVNAIDADGYSVLINAIDAQLDESALFLIEHGADIQFADSRGANALYFAVLNGSWSVFQKLLDKGASPEVVVDGFTLLNTACCTAHKFKRLNLNVSKILNRKLHRVTDKAEIDRVAGKDRYSNFLLIVKKLLALGAEVNAKEGNNEQSSLTLCAARGDVELIDLLLKAGADTELRDKAGLVALHWASRNGFQKVVETLLAHDANPNVAEDYGFTPLHEAAENNHTAIAKALLAAGADKSKGIIKGFAPFDVGDTPKIVATKKGFHELVKLL